MAAYVDRNGACDCKSLPSHAPTTAEQGAAPDRLQLHSFCSFLTSLIPLPAAGELVVVAKRAAWQDLVK